MYFGKRVAMVRESCENLDPRIFRTRKLLQDALHKLLETKEFDKISVQDIAEAATVNRATFYDHYADKFQLLECMVGGRFHKLLAERNVQFGGGCSSALKAIVLALCDYLARLQGEGCIRRLEPHMESAVIAVVRRTLLEGLKLHPPANGISPEMMAAAISWAIYGAVKEWAQTSGRCTAEELAPTVAMLVSPMFQSAQGESRPAAH